MDEADLLPWLVAGALFVVGGGAFAVIAFLARARDRDLLLPLVEERGLVVRARLASAHARGERGGFAVELHRRRGGRKEGAREDLPGTWRVVVRSFALAERTTLHVRERGVSGHLGGIGTRYVELGDAVLDRRLKVGGSDPDVVRGVFADPRVRARLEAICGALLSCRLGRGGALEVLLRAQHGSGDEGVRVLDDVVRFAEALRASEGAHARTLAPPFAQGGASGAPAALPAVRPPGSSG